MPAHEVWTRQAREEAGRQAAVARSLEEHPLIGPAGKARRPTPEERAARAAAYDAWWNSPAEVAWRRAYDARIRVERPKSPPTQG